MNDMNNNQHDTVTVRENQMDSQTQPCDKNITAEMDEDAYAVLATVMETEIVRWIVANNGCKVGSAEGVWCHGSTGRFRGVACPLYMTGLCREGSHITGLNAERTGRLWLKVFHGERVEASNEQERLSCSDAERIAQLEKENSELQNQSERLMEGLFLQVERRRSTEGRIKRLQAVSDASARERHINVIKQMGKVIAQLAGNE
jgi:hypothetical protein